VPEPYAWNDEENREVRRAQRGKEGSDERPRVHGKDSEEVCKQWEATKDEESREAEPRATSRKTMPDAVRCASCRLPRPGEAQPGARCSTPSIWLLRWHLPDSPRAAQRALRLLPQTALDTAVTYGLHQPPKLARTTGFPVCFLVASRSWSAPCPLLFRVIPALPRYACSR